MDRQDEGIWYDIINVDNRKKKRWAKKRIKIKNNNEMRQKRDLQYEFNWINEKYIYMVVGAHNAIHNQRNDTVHIYWSHY